MMTRGPSTRPKELRGGDLQITAECCINQSSTPCDLSHLTTTRWDVAKCPRMSVKKTLRPGWNSPPASRLASPACTTCSVPRGSLVIPAMSQNVRECPSKNTSTRLKLPTCQSPRKPRLYDLLSSARLPRYTRDVAKCPRMSVKKHFDPVETPYLPVASQAPLVQFPFENDSRIEWRVSLLPSWERARACPVLDTGVRVS